MDILKHNYQSNSTFAATFFLFLFFFSLRNYNIYILTVTRLFKHLFVVVNNKLVKIKNYSTANKLSLNVKKNQNTHTSFHGCLNNLYNHKEGPNR